MLPITITIISAVFQKLTTVATNHKQNKELLGKGIRSLLQNIDTDLQESGKLKTEVVTQVTTSFRIPLHDITINSKNPRKHFEEQALNELAVSIKLHDIIQPLTVAKMKDGKYRIIAGERRFRASQLAGLKDVPVYIRNVNDDEILTLALLENLQREDLNAIEVAMGYQRMMGELNYTQEQVAEIMSKERSTIANYVRLLKLPPDVQLAVRNNTISMGHARAIINIDNIDKQLYIFKEIQEKHLSVRQTESLVRNIYTGKSGGQVAAKKNVTLPPTYKNIENKLATHFGTKVKLAHSTKGYGSITIEYFSLQDLNKILEQMKIVVH